ncbi:hypothetical protein LO772_08345 [Yinghuangia sp. ASG 101]|uniref:hypothetical protein n=1 Tax=Yinghuangia sp. ASG 101 TaxID=2896848 RepID=UPI001E62311A|nr:hypothetical protein [Yinghuangia sp. ASG 101]UGQ13598.1 hypothetical protein LO772_08345 [Yinghuangia sp. ASG 101]
MTESTDTTAYLVAGAWWHDHEGFRVRVERLPVENGRLMVEYRGLDDPQVHHVFTQENFLHVFAPATAPGHHGEGAAIRAAVADAITTTDTLAHPATGVLVELAHRAHRWAEVSRRCRATATRPTGMPRSRRRRSPTSCTGPPKPSARSWTSRSARPPG